MRPWQRAFIRDVYEPCGLDGKRIVRRATMSIARKNGKTALMAGLALAHLIGPEAIPNGEIYSAANDREQAGQVFKMAAQIVRADPDLAHRLKVVDSTKSIACFSNGSVYRAISAEAGTKHGLNPSVIIFDELAQAMRRDLFDVLDTAMGGREEPLFITISTQSNDPEHILSRLIDDGMNSDDPTTICHLFSVPLEVENIFDEAVWYQANPALGDFRDLEDFRALARKAQRLPTEEAKFRNLYLNQRVSPISELISRGEWKACQGDAEFRDGERVYLGLDLSSVNDLTALAMVSAEDRSRVKVWFWKPKEWLREHSNRDFGHGNWRYEEWHRAGWLEASPGKVIDHSVITQCIGEIAKRYRILGMAYDRYKIEYLLREFDRIELPAVKEGDKGDGIRLVPWGQGWVSMGPAIDAFEKAVSSRELVHPGNPLLTWNIANAIAVMDPAGNRKLDKDKSRFRIDGAVALAMALGLKARDRQEPPARIRMTII